MVFALFAVTRARMVTAAMQTTHEQQRQTQRDHEITPPPNSNKNSTYEQLSTASTEPAAGSVAADDEMLRIVYENVPWR